jgi:hypothetical protein
MEFTKKTAAESGNALRELFESVTKLSATFPNKELNLPAIQELFKRIEGRPFREGVEKAVLEIRDFLLIACFLSPHIAFLRRPEEERHAVKEAFLHGTQEDIQKATSSAFLDAVRIITDADKFARDRESKQELLAVFDKDVQDYETKVLALLDGKTEPRIPEILALPVFFVLHGILPDAPQPLDEEERKDLHKILNYCRSKKETDTTLAELIKGYKAIPAEIQHYNSSSPVELNTKLVNTALRIGNVINADTIESAFSGKNENLFTEVTATNDHFPDLRNLPPEAFIVNEAVCTAWMDFENDKDKVCDDLYVSPADLWKIYTNASRASKDIVEKLNAGTHVCRTTLITLVDSENMRKLRSSKMPISFDETTPSAGKKWILAEKEPLLDIVPAVWMSENGSVVYGYKVRSKPVLLREAQANRQLFRFFDGWIQIPIEKPKKGKGTSASSRTKEFHPITFTRLKIGRYLLRRIMTMQHMDSHKILIDSVYTEGGVDPTDKKATENCRKWIFVCLDWWKKKKVFATYKREFHGRKLHAVEIIFPIDESKQIATKKATKKKKERAVQ